MFNDLGKQFGFSLTNKAYAVSSYGPYDRDDIEEIIEYCDVSGGSIDGYISNGYIADVEMNSFREIKGNVYGDVTGTVNYLKIDC